MAENEQEDAVLATSQRDGNEGGRSSSQDNNEGSSQKDTSEEEYSVSSSDDSSASSEDAQQKKSNETSSGASSDQSSEESNTETEESTIHTSSIGGNDDSAKPGDAANIVEVIQTGDENEEVGPDDSVELRIGVQLRGILTLHGRTLPITWKCGVCAHEEKNSMDRCGECKCKRVVSWMYNEQNELIQPGVLVEVSSPWRPVVCTRKSKCGNGIREESVVAIVTDVRRMKKEVELCVLWNSKQRTQGVVPFIPGTVYEPVIAVVGAVESKTGSLCLPLKVLSESTEDSSEAISPYPYFAKFGYCGNEGCGGLYDIVDGDLYGHDDELIQLKAQIASETDEADRLKVLKAQYKKAQDFTRVSQVNDDLRVAEARVRAARWKIAPKQTWCPYCTWKCPF
jgi:hypothetical protein